MTLWSPPRKVKRIVSPGDAVMVSGVKAWMGMGAPPGAEGGWKPPTMT